VVLLAQKLDEAKKELLAVRDDGREFSRRYMGLNLRPVLPEQA